LKKKTKNVQNDFEKKKDNCFKIVKSIRLMNLGKKKEKQNKL